MDAQAAGQANLEQQLKQMLECKICFESKERQKLLPCQHTICLDCLNELKVEGSSYKCPICLKEMLVPNGGFEALQESLITKQLASLITLKGGPGSLAGLGTSPGPASAPRETTPPSMSPLRVDSPAPSHAAEDVSETLQLKLTELKDDAAKQLAEAKSKVDKLEADMKETDNMCGMLTESVDRILEDTMNKMLENKERKSDAIKQSANEAKEELGKRKGKLQELIAKTEKRIASLHCIDGLTKEQLKEAQSELEYLKEALESQGKTEKKPKVGDSVRLKLDTESLKPDFLLNSLNHQSVGYLTELDKDGDCAAMFEECGQWRGKIAALEFTSRKHNLPQIGDWVRVKSTVSVPRFRWGMIDAKSMGILYDIKTRGEDRLAFIDFDEDHDWKAPIQEIEKVQAKPLKVGDKVWVSRKVSEPARGWAGVTQSSIGMIVSITDDEVEVDFPECKSWKGMLHEVEQVRRVFVGDHVKVRKDVERPHFDWGGIDHNTVGKVVRIFNTDDQVSPVIKVDFPGRVMHWQGLLGEMEVVKRVSGSDPTTESSEREDSGDERIRCPTQ